MYEAICIACHQPHGLGQEGLAPPLVDSEWVSGSEQRLARIRAPRLARPGHGEGQKYEQDMPALGVLEDDQVANILTYIRREWGHQFPPVSVETVKKIREENAKREDSWTEAELLKIP
jgi:mono/diheme cytochrome c family protein